jgi:hypothetical protein
VRLRAAKGKSLRSAGALAVPEIFRKSALRAIEDSPIFAPVLNALPKPPTWEHVVGWTAAILCPVLAYLWARAEFMGRGRKLWIAFPHNFRFLYPTSRRQEIFAQGLFVLFLIHFILLMFKLHELLSVMIPFIPTDDQGAFFTGLAWSPLVDLIFAGIVPLAGSVSDIEMLRQPSP